MASPKTFSPTSDSVSTSATASAGPTKVPDMMGSQLSNKDSEALVAWVQTEWERAKTARNKIQLQWYTNMAMFYGQQWVEKTASSAPSGYRDTLSTPKKPYYHQRKTINRTRAFVRSELARFLSQRPNAMSVPNSGTDEDQRAALAAEQVWESTQASKKLRYHFARTMWWTTVTGNGFIKTYWDVDCVDQLNKQQGDIKYGAITPFHLFIPDLREQEIEDQPFLINAYTKPLEWCYTYFGKELEGKNLVPSQSAAGQIIDDAYLNLAQPRQKDSCVIYETWLKPGAHKLLPNGGLIISIDNILISLVDGLPYNHDQYPFTKFEHIPSATFYADSPLVDLNSLNKEYNQLRSEIGEAGKRMAKPQLIAQRGSIVPSKITNEPGLIIEYRPGFQPPTPMPLSPLPQYYLDQQDRVLKDWDDLSGDKEVSRGSAPSGISAGTAINYLQEAANQFLTPQYQSIEDGYAKIATQTVELFVQYVDVPRKIKTIGADMAFDTVLLNGADVAGGTDIRMEPGSSVSQSKAAKEARVMDMFNSGLLQPEMALKLLEMGGVQKITDTLAVAEKKQQRENTKMKMLTLAEIQQAQMMHQQELQMQLQQNPELLQQMPDAAEQIANQPAPLLVPIADFDIHAVHLETVNRFRMSQEYESLPSEIKNQIDQHAAAHQAAVEQAKMKQFLEQIPSDGTDPNSAPQLDPSQQQGDANIGGNGVIPQAGPSEG